MRKTIALIQPKRNNLSYNILEMGFPPMGLLTLASLTPKKYRVIVIDELVRRIPRKKFDLVAMTVTTTTAKRVYYLADMFKDKGITVILGGVHVSALPEEALGHCDSVVIGEAEGIWPKVLVDFERGLLKEKYQSDIKPRLDRYPDLDYSLWKRKFGLFDFPVIQTSRGCPHSCDFCNVSSLYGQEVRHYPIPEIIKEVRKRKSHGRTIIFCDDNIIGDKEYARKLFKQLIPLRIKWASQCSLYVAKDKELLSLARKSGCVGLLIGLETIEEEGLKEVHKPIRIDEMESLIRAVRSTGIMILGTFILGLDSHRKDIFRKMLDFIIKNRIDMMRIAPHIPFPGTKSYNRFKEENRIITEEWDLYTKKDVVIEPKNMTPRELEEGIVWMYKEFNSWKNIFGRIWNYLLEGRISLIPMFFYHLKERKTAKRLGNIY